MVHHPQRRREKGSKGSDENTPFNPGFILKIANYLSNLNTKRLEV